MSHILSHLYLDHIKNNFSFQNYENGLKPVELTSIFLFKSEWRVKKPMKLIFLINSPVAGLTNWL